MTNITFVTCYFHVVENEKKPASWRLAHFEKIASLGLNICVYGDATTTPWLEQLAVKYPNICLLNILYDKTPIVRICQSKDWDLPSNRNHEKDTREYLTLMNAKIEFVHDAILKNPFQTNHFAWMDFSMAYLFHNPEDSLQKLQKLSQINLPTNFLAIPGCWSLDSFSIQHIKDKIHWRFCGTFFIGDSNSIQQFYKLYETHFPKFLLNMRCLTWEVNFWAWLEVCEGWKPQWYESDHNDKLMNIIEIV